MASESEKSNGTSTIFVRAPVEMKLALDFVSKRLQVDRSILVRSIVGAWLRKNAVADLSLDMISDTILEYPNKIGGVK